jgi:hypothetical protein
MEISIALPLVSLAVASESLFFACALRRIAARTAKPARRVSAKGANQEKITKRKHTPSSRPARCAGSAGFAGFFDSTSLYWSKNARRPAARPAGLIREPRRLQGPRQIKINSGFGNIWKC